MLLSALTDITGSADAAIREASRMLRIRGVVLPVTLTDSALRAQLADGSVIEGDLALTGGAENSHLPIERVYLEPSANAYPPVLDAIAQADAL